MPMRLESYAFENGERIPDRCCYRDIGKNSSPALHWSGVPENTRELVLIMDDPDAPTDEPWVHWVLYGIPATVSRLQEAFPAMESLSSPAGAMQGRNSFGEIGYGGPMPPEGHGVHHYHFRIFGLDQPLSLDPGLARAAVDEAMKGHVLDAGVLVGTYSR
jgi:Raf kinase inhibitor-like YbhB/YbcL family protein